MAVYAVSGNLHSGKSTVLKLLKKRGAAIFDADKKIHRYYRDKNSAVFKKVSNLFPDALCNGSISRKRLGEIVFSNPSRLKKLESAVHPYVITELKRWIRAMRRKNKVACAEVPLLFEKKLERYFDGIILVTTKQSILTKRIGKKLGLSLNVALKRLKLYLPTERKIKKSDFIIENNGTLRDLEKKVSLLWKRIKGSAGLCALKI